MKKLLSFSIALITLVFSVTAQTNAKLSAVLSQYYSVKNALVSGDAVKAGVSAAEFVKAVNEADQKSIGSVHSKLLADGGSIAASKDISKQREVFASLSNNMIALAKAAKLSDAAIYVDYCPMKKSSWLSDDKAIKNPYYGSSMLTCGSVKETIKQ